MDRIAPATGLIDVEYLGRSRYIGCALLEDDLPAIIDPGPAVSLDGLERGLEEAGLGLGDLAAILLTHIHLDHAGATGSIVQRNPGIRVHVHERGARHLADPSRLLTSARRLYGEEMDRLWGEFLPVPEENLEPLSGGEVLQVAGRDMEVAYTPGHASHHVGYFDPTTRIAFVGDTAGIRIAGVNFVLPVTPPPDIDLEAWDESQRQIEAWHPERLFVTHFGPGDHAQAHLAEHRERLSRWADSVRRGLDGNETEARAIERFVGEVEEELARHLSPGQAELYRQGGAPEMSWHGLARYWRKRGVGVEPGPMGSAGAAARDPSY